MGHIKKMEEKKLSYMLRNIDLNVPSLTKWQMVLCVLKNNSRVSVYDILLIKWPKADSNDNMIPHPLSKESNHFSQHLLQAVVGFANIL